ncbi:MAG: 3-phosphoshikimate 1-carboxyvinyltransferase [Solirubrobacteraceae bacterium]|jgi:3-phosphoshikimate 1-carboxyvinyltransferase|nr:3-phosphoshikimate 1-carboxyvinyltransferase [Solirubrobacteraceae bacterium]
MTNVRFEPAGALRGELTAPADKSISHRAALLGAISGEAVEVENYLHAADTDSTLAAVRRLGAVVEIEPARDGGRGRLRIRGVGLHGPGECDGPIDVGNAGTLMRLLPGWLAGQDGRSWTLDGDASIRRRPVDRIAEPLRAMGATLTAREGRFAPFVVTGAPLHGIAYDLPVASAQVKSCILLAAIAAEGETTLTEPAPSRDHTERMLLAGGVGVGRDAGGLHVRGGEPLRLSRIRVPGDLSSAAFAIAAAVLVPGSRVIVRGVGVNWTRTGFLRILGRMGASVVGELEEPDVPLGAGEPIEDLEVVHGRLVGTVVEAAEVPLAIDELPLVGLVGCFAEGETIVRGAGELRLKESDRIATVVDGLRGLGGQIEATEDGFVVRGTGGLRGGRLEAHGDHRLAMMGAVAGLASREGVEVIGMDAAAVSYPGFARDVARLVG